jgi:hypothetical protein
MPLAIGTTKDENEGCRDSSLPGVGRPQILSPSLLEGRGDTGRKVRWIPDQVGNDVKMVLS